MAANNVENYLRHITQNVGDPTFSILKSHLLLEDLLRSFLTNSLPHPNALAGARLTFAQLLAVVRASSASIPEDFWIWKALAELNRIRNMLSHEIDPKAIKEKIDAYVRYVEHSCGVPLPETKDSVVQMRSGERNLRYREIDIVTVALYYVTAARLGFNVDEALAMQERRDEALGE